MNLKRTADLNKEKLLCVCLDMNSEERLADEMKIKLLDVDESNWRQCVELNPIKEERTFVDSNAFAIAEWKFEPDNVIKAIYANSEISGMLAYYLHDGDYGHFYWLYHLMIEPRFQGKGYGQAAVVLALKEMRQLGARDIVTNCTPKNVRALHIYKKLGFTDNGTLDGGDIFLRHPAESTR